MPIIPSNEDNVNEDSFQSEQESARKNDNSMKDGDTMINNEKMINLSTV